MEGVAQIGACVFAIDLRHVFEMPLLGYGGYIPFSLELFALYYLIVGLSGKKESQDFIVVTSDRLAEPVSQPSAAAL